MSDLERLMLLAVLPAGLAIIIIGISIGALVYVVRNKKDKKMRGNSCVTDTTSVISRDPSLLTFGHDCYEDEGYANCQTNSLFNSSPSSS